MTSVRSLRHFLSDDTGAAAAEFALVSILFLSLMLGTIDMARLMWELNSAKAATRAAVRLAVVTTPVAADLAGYDAVDELGLPAGSPVPDGTLPTYTCTDGACSAGAVNATAFTAIVNRMQDFYGRIQPGNVVIEYEPVGLGFAGNPYGPDVEPLVTVRLCTNSAADVALGCDPVQFAPGILQAFGMDPFNIPAVASSLSGEDLA